VSVAAAEIELTALPALELLPTPELRWWTPEFDGFIHTPEQLLELISRIGSAPGWEWLTVDTDTPGFYAQAFGSQAGVVTEVSTGNDPRLVAQAGATSWSRRNVGVFGWHYLAHPDELHPPTRAFGILADWLYDKRID
jgi:hypothetical protein